jgi:hypothetical protein
MVGLRSNWKLPQMLSSIKSGVGGGSSHDNIGTRFGRTRKYKSTWQIRRPRTPTAFGEWIEQVDMGSQSGDGNFLIDLQRLIHPPTLK